MRIALTLSLQIDRAPKPEPPQPDEPRPPMVDHKGSFIMERAEPQPIGFTADLSERRVL